MQYCSDIREKLSKIFTSNNKYYMMDDEIGEEFIYFNWLWIEAKTCTNMECRWHNEHIIDIDRLSKAASESIKTLIG